MRRPHNPRHTPGRPPAVRGDTRGAFTQRLQNLPRSGPEAGAPVRKMLLDNKTKLASKVGPLPRDACKDGHRKRSDGHRGLHRGEELETSRCHKTDQGRGNIDGLEQTNDVSLHGIVHSRVVHPVDHLSEVGAHQRRVTLRTDTDHPRGALRDPVFPPQEERHQLLHTGPVGSHPGRETVGLSPGVLLQEFVFKVHSDPACRLPASCTRTPDCHLWAHSISLPEWY